ncbi:MAG: HlyD family efflux transporter periplasmic adaptor subunit, partial [Planctomycetaceae bacterium]|nr:HlyD family efflux transporter periplasmic adaptor subunit [Planctomycetaceae bacterium]
PQLSKNRALRSTRQRNEFVFSPASQRPLPFVRRSDLQYQPIASCGDGNVIVKDPIRLAYYRLSPLQFDLWQRLDGSTNWEQLERDLRAKHKDQISTNQLQRLLHDLVGKQLVWSERLPEIIDPASANPVGVSREHPGTSAPRKILSNLLFLRLPGWDPSKFLRVIEPLARPLFCSSFATGLALFVTLTWLFLFTHFEDFNRQLPALGDLLTPQSFLFLWLAIGLAKVMHELAHGITCQHYGGECHSIGVAFLIFSPCLYCDVSDAWMLSRKRDRLIISAAGMILELGLSAIAFWLWWFARPGWWQLFFLQLFLVTSVSTILFNANPLLRYDGYYILSDLLEIPNLQRRSRQSLEAAYRWLLFDQPGDPGFGDSPGSPTFLFIYGVASLLYRWALVWGIGWMLFTFLAPVGLQSLATVYLGISVLAAFIEWGAMTARAFKSPSPGTVPHVRILTVASLVLLCGVIAWNVPIPVRTISPVVLKPAVVRNLYVELPGELHAIFVRPGDEVLMGQTIAEFHNPDLERNRLLASEEREIQQVDLALARAQSNTALKQVAEFGIRTADFRVTEAQGQTDRLTLRSPIAGTILPAPFGEEAHLGDETSLLRNDHPLTDRHVGEFFRRRTLICQIADKSRWQATAWIDSDSVPAIQVGDEVAVRLNGLPKQTLTGTVQTIAVIEEEANRDSPRELGGVVRQQSYRVTIDIDTTSAALIPGMRGTVRYRRSRQTVGTWLVRSFHRTFRTW